MHCQLKTVGLTSRHAPNVYTRYTEFEQLKIYLSRLVELNVVFKYLYEIGCKRQKVKADLVDYTIGYCTGQ